MPSEHEHGHDETAIPIAQIPFQYHQVIVAGIIFINRFVTIATILS